MKKIALLTGMISLVFTVGVFGQMPVVRESNRQEISQTIGDSKVTIVYFRPNVKGRKIYGCSTTELIQKGNNTDGPCLVPNGQVWRTGANDNTTVEFTHDVSINGKNLPAGKYAFFAIPSASDWTLIFNKVNNEWGAFNYKVEQDALRVNVMPVKTKTSRETLMYEFESISGFSSKIVLSWEKLQVPFTVNVGDVLGRSMVKVREAVKNAKADDMRTLNQAVGFVVGNKVSSSYEEAQEWINKSIAIRETFANLQSKARLLAEMGKKQEAIETGEKAVTLGKAATPAADTSNFEKMLTEWKTKKAKK